VHFGMCGERQNSQNASAKAWLPAISPGDTVIVRRELTAENQAAGRHAAERGAYES
jgi:hypothetical protein